MNQFPRGLSGLFVFLVAGRLLTGCESPERHGATESSREIVFDLDKSDERRLLSFYLGGLLSRNSSDPFEASIIVQRRGTFLLDTERLGLLNQDLLVDMKSLTDDGVITWDEFEQFINERYYAYREFPKTTDRLMDLVGDWSLGSDWFSFEVNGVMSPHRRKIHVPLVHLRNALSGYRENGDRLLYAVGTTFVSEHIDRGERVEVSVMRKREDGFWDFFAYGATGGLTGEVVRSPNNLVVPSKCIGCHFGSRLFEPERSFPADASPAPEGPRALYVQKGEKDVGIVRLLDEHRRRSDTVLGLYGTLFLGRLKAQRAAGSISEEDRKILEMLGL